MVVINREKCTGCGTCLKICHEHCLERFEGQVRIRPLGMDSRRCPSPRRTCLRPGSWRSCSASGALANMYYTAQALDVACCLFGPGRIVLDRSRTVPRRLGLGAH
jgi:Fe-S-cluster-containing hydrogenase component 2